MRELSVSCRGRSGYPRLGTFFGAFRRCVEAVALHHELGLRTSVDRVLTTLDDQMPDVQIKAVQVLARLACTWERDRIRQRLVGKLDEGNDDSVRGTVVDELVAFDCPEVVEALQRLVAGNISKELRSRVKKTRAPRGWLGGGEALCMLDKCSEPPPRWAVGRFGNLSAIVAAERAFPAAVAELADVGNDLRPGTLGCGSVAFGVANGRRSRLAVHVHQRDTDVVTTATDYSGKSKSACQRSRRAWIVARNFSHSTGLAM